MVSPDGQSAQINFDSPIVAPTILFLDVEIEFDEATPGGTPAIYELSSLDASLNTLETVTFESRTSEPVPTISEWGLVVIGLLLLIGATIVLGFRRSALIGMSGGPVALASPLPLFAGPLFARCLGVGVALLAVILALVVWLEGSVNATDLTGSSLTAMGVAYLVHLWLLLRRRGPQG
jgi:hypothetical protein